MIPFYTLAGTSLLAGSEDMLVSGQEDPTAAPGYEPSVEQVMPIVNTGGAPAPWSISSFPSLPGISGPTYEPTLVTAQPIVGSIPDPMMVASTGRGASTGSGGQLRPSSSLVSDTAPADTLPGTADDKSTAKVALVIGIVVLLCIWFGRHA